VEDRWLGAAKSRKVFALADVLAHGRYATCQAEDGRLFEYDLGCFWVSDMSVQDAPRTPLNGDHQPPEGPWRHSAVCDCEGCASHDASA
jgi:hypothetical protein